MLSEKKKQSLRVSSLKQYNKHRTTPLGKARQIQKAMRINSQVKGYEWDKRWWSIETVMKIVSEGKCAVTGISFTIRDSKGTGDRNPFSASPDRIDNSKGYEPDNVQWVVFIYNLMKSNFKDEDIDVFVKALKKHSS
jgi:hypothetical protein